MIAELLDECTRNHLDRPVDIAVALNVDVDNATGALRLYEKAELSPVPAFTISSKALAGDP
jgi:hypothetical protein